MATLLKFVDAIAASPTTRLDLNDGAIWKMRSFNAPPPRLRRSMGSNAMGDGGFVSSTAYDMRTLYPELSVERSTGELKAVQLQLLARELDRADNYLMYQAEGMTKPVFFRTKRSDISALLDTRAQPGMSVLTPDLLCEPFALGLRETLGPYTVNNDPAAGSNGCYVDVTGVIGDVASPCFIQNTSAWRTYGLLASRLRGTPSDMVRFKQAESCTLGVDTTNPGGGPDALMSGAGTNNYVRTSFATNATMIGRVTWALASDITTQAQREAMRGDFRVVAAVRRSATTSTINARAYLNFSGGRQVFGDTVALPATTVRTIIDFGIFNPSPVPAALPFQAATAASGWPEIEVQAERVGGTDTLDWDCLLLIPADEQTLSFGNNGVQDTGLDQAIDGYQGDIYVINGADPFAATAYLDTTRTTPAMSGSFPSLVPGRTNRIFAMFGASLFMSPVTDTNALTFHYWPQYLFVRPSAT